MHVVRLSVVVALATCVFGTAHAQSLPRPSPPAAESGEARPIAGWVEFCSRMPAECQVDIAETAIIKLTPKAWATIIAINKQVNGSINYVPDQDQWGVPDHWDIPMNSQGDVEDYALLKRKLLGEAGLPRRAMRMTVVIDEKNEGHAVLMIRTDRGDMVLDNKVMTVMPWFETGYVYVKRESQDRQGWVSLGGAVSPTVTATRRR